MVMPAQKPGRSKQDYSTPKEFLEAVKARLGIVEFNLDVAADADNAVCRNYYTAEQDALSNVWPWASTQRGGWIWCNPPYGNIRPWVEKANFESLKGAQIAMLIPASVGANWWLDFVHGSAHVIFLNGRLSFDGVAPYPKDCALLLWTPWARGGYEVWDWSAK